MIKVVAKRLLSAVPTLLALMTLTFFIMKVVPGGPFDEEKALPPEIKANLEAKYHFNEPVWKQYGRYLGDLSRGDFGPSYRYLGGRTVNDIIGDALPVSAELGFYAIVFAIAVGIPVGVLSAYKKNSWLDFSAMFWAMAGVSLPNFLVASILVLVFSVHLGWLPPALWEDWRSAILPVITLAVRPLALIARLTRASMLEALATDYVRTAQAKGLGMGSVLFKHALKNALVPVVTLTGPLVAAVITGSFVVEFFFAIPGLGKHFISAVTDRDYPLIMGVTMVYGVIVIAANLLVDLTYAWIDPRMRVG
ncbi:MAG: ABC transporter permease [Deltaproteobacteria bacterium]|nr:ABC transporter permease [Deltaproteobacteria bacterium]